MFTVLILVLLALGYVAYQYFTRTSAQASQGTGLSAFARVAEADGKIIALKATNAAHLVEAKAIHVVQDEIKTLLG